MFWFCKLATGSTAITWLLLLYRLLHFQNGVPPALAAVRIFDNHLRLSWNWSWGLKSLFVTFKLHRKCKLSTTLSDFSVACCLLAMVVNAAWLPKEWCFAKVLFCLSVLSEKTAPNPGRLATELHYQSGLPFQVFLHCWLCPPCKNQETKGFYYRCPIPWDQKCWLSISCLKYYKWS